MSKRKLNYGFCVKYICVLASVNRRRKKSMGKSAKENIYLFRYYKSIVIYGFECGWHSSGWLLIYRFLALHIFCICLSAIYFSFIFIASDVHTNVTFNFCSFFFFLLFDWTLLIPLIFVWWWFCSLRREVREYEFVSFNKKRKGK